MSDTQNVQPEPQRPPLERAEELMNRAGERFGQLATEAGFRLRQALARAREEAEDIWAEAQTLRQNGHERPTSPSNGESVEERKQSG